MFDAEQYIAEYQEMEPGAPRLRALKKAIQAADAAKNPEWQFIFRHRYLHDSIFDSDDVDAMIIFPEMLAIYDANPDLHEEHQRSMLWDYKLLLENAIEFTHIPLTQIEQLYAEFEARCKKLGYSLRAYRYLKEKFSIQSGNLLPASEYGRYLQEPEDELKDCTACERSYDVSRCLLLGDPEQAKEIGAPIFEGKVHCAEVPETTFDAWIAYDIRQGDYTDALYLAKRLYPLVRGKLDLLEEIGTLLTLYAQTNLHTGLNIFRRALPQFMECRNHWMQLRFAEGAYRLFAAIDAEHIGLALPRSFSLWNAEGYYEVAALCDYFKEKAFSLAEKFDARNGNTAQIDRLNKEYPVYDAAQCMDLKHGYVQQQPSVIGAVCAALPDSLSIESVTALLEQDGKYSVALARSNEEHGLLQFQITEGDACYQLMLTVQEVPPAEEFRPAGPVPSSLKEEIGKAEAMILCIMPFGEEAPDQALQFQLRLLHLLCPDAVAFLDCSRMKLLPAGWVALQANSDVPPLVDYLYSLQIYGGPDRDSLWITTAGLACCGLRDVEIIGATKTNYARFCDLLCFTIERFLLRGMMPDAQTPMSVLQKQNGQPLVCTWLPVSKAKELLEETEGWAVRSDQCGDDENHNEHAVLFLHDGEGDDGHTRITPLHTITMEEFETFGYGCYIATQRKIAAMAKERFHILKDCAARSEEPAYVCVHIETEEDEDDIWMQLQSIENEHLIGVFTADCIGGKEGTEYTADLLQLTDFSVRLNGLTITPNTAYLAKEL